MSLYDALYNDKPLPSSVRCTCGRVFKPEKDKETYCSANCARNDSMRGLLGDDTLYRQNALRMQTQDEHQRRTRTEREKDKQKPLPRVLTIWQNQEPPTPLPKSARHLPQNRRDGPSAVNRDAPPVPRLPALHSRRTEIPPTPPPKSARHLPQGRSGHGRDGRRGPHGGPSAPPPPVPALPLSLVQTRQVMAQEVPRAMRADQGHTAKNARIYADPPRTSSSSEWVVIEPFVLPEPRIVRRPTYDGPSREAVSRVDVRRSASMPFLQRPVGSASRAATTRSGGRAKHAIYGPPVTQHPSAAIPKSPPPAYTPSPIYANVPPTTRQVVRPKDRHKPPPIRTASGDVFVPFLERAVRGSNSNNSQGTHQRAASQGATSNYEAQGTPGDVWRAVRGLRDVADEDYKQRFLERETPRW